MITKLLQDFSLMLSSFAALSKSNVTASLILESSEPSNKAKAHIHIIFDDQSTLEPRDFGDFTVDSLTKEMQHNKIFDELETEKQLREAKTKSMH